MSQGFPLAGTPAPLLPLFLPSKDFRHRFIIAKDNLKVNSLERKWSPDRAPGRKILKIPVLAKLRANKISVISKLLIFHGFLEQPAFFVQFCPNFSPESGPNLGLWGQNCSGTKKISAASLAKVTDIPHFTPHSRCRGPALTPILCHVCTAYVPLSCPPARPASGLLPNTTTVSVRQKERNFQKGWQRLTRKIVQCYANSLLNEYFFRRGEPCVRPGTGGRT